MLTHSQIKKYLYSYTLVAVMLLGLFLVPQNFATAATTKLELTQRISQQLSSPTLSKSSGNVLGQNVSIPFFPRGFVYPIAQLGNCMDQKSCFEFCEDSNNLEICALVSFRNGSMTAEQLKKTLTFSSYLQAGYFATCDGLNSCAELCDQKSSEQECAVLALGLEQGSRVLGAQDVSKDKSFNYGVGAISGLENNIIGSLNNLIYAGNAPAGCSDAKSCVEYCSSTPSNPECNDLFTEVSRLSGVWDGQGRPGRVLNVSIDNLSAVPGLSDVLDPGTDTGGGTNPSTTYQPQSYLGCITNKQATTSPPIISPSQTSSPQEGDVFADSVSQCDSQYNTTQTQAQNYTNLGRQKATESISTITECIFGLDSSIGIQDCLAQ